MLGAAFQFGVSAGFIVGAGILVTRCADVIAARTGLGRLLVGSIFLAAATSLPELMTDLNAVWLNRPDLAVGDLMGSCLFNLLILAIADLAHRSRGVLLSRLAAAHALSGTLTIVLAALAGIGILFEPHLHGFAVFGVGPFSIVIAASYFLGVRLVFYDQQTSIAVKEVQESQNTAPWSLGASLIGYSLSVAVILWAAPSLAEAAGQLSDLTGLGGTFVGTTLVAFSTSLPELVATVSAVRMGAYDLGIGNVFGSNAFNMLLILPLDFANHGPLLSIVSPTHTLTCLIVILITAIVLLGQLYRVERRVFFVEPDAAVVIALVIAALGIIYVAA